MRTPTPYRIGSYYSYQGQRPRTSRQLPSVTTPTQSKRHFTAVWIVLGLIGILLVFHGLTKHPDTKVTAIANKKDTSAYTRPDTTSTSLATSSKLANMTSTINQTITSTSGYDISVSIHDLNSDKYYQYGDDAAFEAASTAKVLTASLFLHKVELGTASMTATVNGHSAQYELTQMITISDNDAWLSLMAYLGGHPALQAYAQSLGLNNYTADGNTITSANMTQLLTKLYVGSLLSSSHTEQLLGLMKQANKTEFIVDNIPSNATVYHKAGWLDDRGMDTAIITDGTHSYVLTIFTKANDGSYDYSAGDEIFKEITDATTATFLQS